MSNQILTPEKTGTFRFRNVAMILGVIASILMTFLTDPSSLVLFKVPMGVSVILLIKSLVYFAVAAMVVHLGFKSMFDYIERGSLIKQAIEDKQSGTVLIGLAIFVLAFAIVFASLINLTL